ncbi:MAG: peptide-N-glycosidase F-related protein [Myxococcota bacterium]
MLRVLVLGLSFGLFACGDDVDTSIPADATPDATVDATVDASVPDGDADVPLGFCGELGLDVKPFEENPTGGFGDIAGDFVVELLDGSTFQLSERWTGCETYVFINYFESAVGDQLWAGILDPMLQRSPRNVQYFFTSYERDPAAARTRAEAMAQIFQESSEFLTPEELAYWQDRVHFVVEPLTDINGSVGNLARGAGSVQFAFAIDRFQRFDPVGSLAQIGTGGFVQRLGMAAYAPHYYNYLHDLDARIAAETNVTVVPLVSETNFSERVFQRTAMLPSPAEVQAFDTLEIDVQLTCRLGAPECSEWDRIASIDACVDATCEDRRELVRWITPYSRPGLRRWVMDQSALLPLLHGGGEQAFQIELGPNWERATMRDVEISLRFSNRGGDRPIGIERAFVGGRFDASYNEREPFSLTPPAGAQRAELVVIVSGHGQDDANNCAEWCNHEHQFVLNGGTERRIDFPGQVGEALGCAELAQEGVVPGQYGNWAPRRAGWCPGYPVAPVRIDISEDLNPGAANALSYTATLNGGSPTGMGNVDLSAYVTYYP